MSSHREIETTYDVAADTEVPSLRELPGVEEVSVPEHVELEATYLDTADLDLVRAGITLRRRRGGGDEGWHLKLPTRHGRWEVHEPLGSDLAAPERLVDVVRTVTRGEALEPVALLRTHRDVRRLRAADGTVLAELTDDRVSAQSPPQGVEPPRAWREWEVELVDGDAAFLELVTARLGEHGVRPAALQSKLVRALGERRPEPAVPARLGKRPTAQEVVHARLRELVAELRRADPLLRADAPGAVHRARVTIRRLRSALATYRPLLDREVTDPLRAHLRWLGSTLAEARDAEVLRRRLLADLQAAPRGERIAAFVDRELGSAYDEGHQRALASMRTERYAALLAGLDELVADPPWREPGSTAGPRVLRRRVTHDWKRLTRTAATVGSEERAEDLHEVRKAVKRVRYAAEPLARLGDPGARRFVKSTKRLQATLGRHHDDVVRHHELDRLADLADVHGENAFALGRLQAHLETDLAGGREEFAAAWRHASSKKTRRWAAGKS